MYSIKGVKDELITLENLKLIIESYEEISAMRMRRVKKSVLQNREFLDGLQNLYGIVHYFYNSHPKKKFKKGQNMSLSTNDKTVAILLSANTGLYGDIVKKTFDSFIKEISGKEIDLAVVGRIGRKFYEENKYTKPYVYFDLSDSGTDPTNIKNIIDHVLTYKNIIVYHGLFRNILQQEPARTFVTGEAMEYTKETQGKEKTNTPKFIFEPSVETVASFFDSQLLAALFEQTVHESSLSKFASRMVNLDYASENISTKLEFTNYEMRKLKHRRMNSTQLSSLSGISLWKDK